MKRMKKIVSILLAVVMVIGMSMTAFAEPGDGGDGGQTPPATGTTNSGAATVDDEISVSGLRVGDKAEFYQVLKWDGNWVAADGFTGLTKKEIETIVGDKANQTNGIIDSDMAGKLGGYANNVSSPKYEGTADETKTVKVAGVDAGLYIVIIIPGNNDGETGYTYNPVFVAADYNSESLGTGNGDTNTWNITLAKSYSDTAMAKLNEIKVDKTSSTNPDLNDDNQSETVSVDEEITFTIKTTIPGFASNYTSPVFKVSDALSPGLKLKADSIEVKTPEGDNYTIPEASLSDSGFTVEFKTDYLRTCKVATAVEITYKATVEDIAAASVNRENNKVTVNFSNSPKDTVGKGILKDETNHYTFNIDGDLWGENSYHTTEVVKIGVDKDGNEITETKVLSNGHTVGALQGAEFSLYRAVPDATDNTKLVKGELYTSDAFSGTVSSDENGRIPIRGLDAGKYYLEETKAPEGYVKSDKLVLIEIKANIGEVDVEEKVTVDGVEYTVKYKTNVLKSYTVEIDGKQTASYTITNKSEKDKTSEIDSVDKGDTVIGPDSEFGKIRNTIGVALPSTGGIGTTIFYVAGGILVLAAVVLLVTKKRMSLEK